MSLLFIALAPVIVILIYIYIKDKYEKEPLSFLFENFILGAIVSIVVTLVLGYFIQRLFPITNKESIIQQFIKAFFIVGFVEEFSKYIIVRYHAQKNAEFNEPFDGIVYALVVSMGFAALENIIYVYQYGFTTGLTRAFTAIPAHATFGILMGYFMGKAKFSKNNVKYNLLGLLVATVFHGAYDFFLFLDFLPGIAIGAFISLLIGVLLSKKAITKHQDISQFKT
ncbi:PrsW family intramembrane metalloprotease [Polaribacter sp.]|jgi:protease PrsW|uniref:PrsW family intramembrane metalloprotease n=1 Tax=Polaribacter sp. TaxID=1920175 RepID=UPI003F69C3D5